MADAGSRRLLNATAVMASGTMVSRVLGLVRAMMIAIVLGNTGLHADTFTLAMTVPNSLYMLLAGGTLNNVLVPQIVRAVLHDEDAGKAFVDRIMTGFLILLGGLTVILTIAVPWVMSLYTQSAWRTEAMAEHWQALLLMSYITMPQLFFYGVFFLIGQVLNARDSFGPMMWAPIVNNVVAIAVFGVYLAIWGTNMSSGEAFTTGQIWLLGAGSTLGIAIQTVVLIPFLRKAGFSYRPRFDLKGTGLGRTFHVAKWMVGYVTLTSLAQIVVSNLASTAAPIDPVTGAAAGGAGLAAYQSAYLIWILPHSLLTVSLATAMLPAASRAATAGDLAGVRNETVRAVRLATTFLMPASIGMILLAGPTTSLIFSHGAGSQDYQYVAWALMAFSVGLIPYTIQYLYLRAFYALDDTRTPFLLQIGISGANVVLATALVLPIDDPNTIAMRLALAYALAYWIGVFFTHRALSRRLGGLAGRDSVQHLTRLGLASVPTGVVAFLAMLPFGTLESKLWTVLGLVVAAGAGVGVFFLTARRLQIPEASELVSVLRRRGRSAAVETPVETVADTSADDSAPIEVTNPDPDGVGVFVSTAPLTPRAALTFPEPSAADRPAIGSVPGLGDRYRPVELLAAREGQRTWRATDSVLDRAVLIHQLKVDDPHGYAVAEAARRAALATDSRFLRVLDVIEPDPGRHGTVLVYEYSPGDTLQHLLSTGPLSGAETAWVIRELADALSELHSAGLYHRHLHPGTVLISSTGNVKIIGLLVEEAQEDEAQHRRNGEAEDVRSLGKLLYACLVARWPGADDHGLAAAPVIEGRLALPSEVRSGVAHPVEVIVDRVLSVQPRRGATRITTAAAITTELSLVLGPSSAAGDLRQRLGYAAPTLNSLVSPPVPTPARQRLEAEELLSEDPLLSEETQSWAPPDQLDTPAPFTPIPPPPATSDEPPVVALARTRWLVGTVGILLAFALFLVWVLLNRGSDQAAPAPAPVPVRIAKAIDFDPKQDGGSGAENPKQTTLAIDGDPDTAWFTERYKGSADFAGLKAGAGLVLDLGEAKEITTVTVDFGKAGGSADLLVPVKEEVTKAPLSGLKQWRRLGDLSSGSLTVEPVTTRFVLVYLTELAPAGDDYFRGSIAEVVVSR